MYQLLRWCDGGYYRNTAWLCPVYLYVCCYAYVSMYADIYKLLHDMDALL
mgnify:CR=1 FL=1